MTIGKPLMLSLLAQMYLEKVNIKLWNLYELMFINLILKILTVYMVLMPISLCFPWPYQ